MPRISLKVHHKQYLNLLAEQMGCDTSTALDYAFWELKRIGFSFSSPLPSAPVHAAQIQTLQQPQSVGAFTPYQEIQPVPSASAVEEDEIINRLLKLGIEEF